jgi:hypothetical protein
MRSYPWQARGTPKKAATWTKFVFSPLRANCCLGLHGRSGLCATGAAAQSPRQSFVVPTGNGGVLVESFGDCTRATCPAVLILSGSKGFAAPVYGEIGHKLRTRGLSAYLVRILSHTDLDAIAAAGGASARTAYYAKRLPNWMSGVHGVISHLDGQARHGGRVGILGISLGAQIASAASAGRTDVDALVLVDGGFPNGYSQAIDLLPPLHLI